MPYFNSSQPNPSSKNSINSISTTFGIRDFLLLKNLPPKYPSQLSKLPSPKIGEYIVDTTVNSGSNQIPYGLPLETEGIFNMELSVITNQFKNNDSTSNYLTVIENQQKLQGPWGNVDYPMGLKQYPRTANNDTKDFGIMSKTDKVGYRTKLSTKNLYLDIDKQIDVADYINLQNGDITQNLKSYSETYGALKIGDLLGSIISGQGIGVTKNGLISNFDLKSSLLGRVLGTTGIINDTKLGMIGGQQLVLALANNTVFNVEQKILGTLNAQENILSLVKNGTLAGFRPNYQITAPSSTLGQVLDTSARILGFTLPKSFLSDSGSIFQTENGNVENIDRANSMILNTGKGQVVALLANSNANLNGTSSDGSDSPMNSVFRTGYAPGYTDNKGVKQIEGNNIYAFSKEGHIIQLLKPVNGVIPELSINRIGMVENSGFNDLSGFGPLGGQTYVNSNIKKPGFTWTSSKSEALNVSGKYNQDGSYAEPAWDEYVGDKKSLLSKTQTLFNNVGLRSIVSSKGDMMIKTPSQIQTSVVGGGISKGNPVMKASSYTKDGYYDGSQKTAEETYCRSWTTTSRYEKLMDLVRSRDLDKRVPYRTTNGGTVGSILDDNGFPKISPYSTDNPSDPKKFMFSLENLAWYDKVTDLLPSEQGSGDLVTGKKGRIMWFPPYNINFTENNSVNWETNNFIGRGESIYTYNNTERSGTLSFQIIVDHPSYVNAFSSSKGSVVDDHYVASFFAGCVEPDKEFSDKLTVNEINTLEQSKLSIVPLVAVTEEKPPVTGINVYYPNDNATFNPLYENGLQNPSTTPIDYATYTAGYSVGLYPSDITPGITPSWLDDHNFGYNGVNGLVSVDGVNYSGWSDSSLATAIGVYLDTKCPNCVVTVSGYASIQGTKEYNQILADTRADRLIAQLKNVWFTKLNEVDRNKRIVKGIAKEITGTSCIKTITNGVHPPVDTPECKKDRKATISFAFSPQLQQESKQKKFAKPPIETPISRTVNTKITNRFYNEQNYFEKLNQTDPFVFDSFREKIKYFHPAFHSTTPEGLNSRLTFLLQCTRQGPTAEERGANNLVFGRPPVCILRIGDFYNTKIIIDNIGINYEPLVWDLNPEGIGVQPMIANVDISFKFIGGSTLMGPINKLQNALSFNYFANAQVYDPRADYISLDKTKDRKKTINGKERDIVGYSVVDGFKGNMNIDVLASTTITKGPEINQELVELEDIHIEETQPTVSSSITIYTLSCDVSKIVKTTNSWNLSVKLYVNNGTDDPIADANELSLNGHIYSLRITDFNSTETYQEILNQFTIGTALTLNSESTNFIIPIKKSKSDTTDGIVDSFGKENFVLEIMEDNNKIAGMNFKLN